MDGQPDQQTWDRVDDYVEGALCPPDEVLEAILASTREAGLPEIQVSAAQGALLQLLVRVRRASRVLEIGTLAGYSTVWLARGMAPGGRLVTLEADPRHAAVAVANLRRAGLEDVVSVVVGEALATVGGVGGDGPFDVVFIDADKENSAAYVEWGVRLSRPGSVVVLDNVVRGGAVADADSADSRVLGMRTAIDVVAAHPRLSGTVIQTVGRKGYDGFLVATVS